MKANGATEQDILRFLVNGAENAKQTQQSKIEKDKAKAKAKGFTHFVLATIHPSSGDDYQTGCFYPFEPTQQDILKLLKKSTVKNDYLVEAL